MVLDPIRCPDCGSDHIIKHGVTAAGKPRYRCKNEDCSRRTFIQEYSYQAYYPVVQKQISDMALNGSGIRDTARVLNISPTRVIKTLKKSSKIQSINEPLLAQIDPSHTQGILIGSDEIGIEAELDEIGSFRPI